jgi:hypothetical protein
MIAMNLKNLGINREDVTVEKLLAGTGKYKNISSLRRFAIRLHEFFGDFAAARQVAQESIGSTNDAFLETRLVGKINEKLGGNKLAEGGIVYSPPGCKPGLYRVQGGKLSELEVGDGACIHNPLGCEKGTYQVRVKGSHGSLEKLKPNTVVLNPRGASGAYVVDADGNLTELNFRAGTCVANPRGVGANGEEKSLTAGEAYRVGADGRNPKKLAAGTAFTTFVEGRNRAFTTVLKGGLELSYVVGTDGQPMELKTGECVRVSGDKGIGRGRKFATASNFPETMCDFREVGWQWRTGPGPMRRRSEQFSSYGIF